jgi:hypothetical protein
MRHLENVQFVFHEPDCQGLLSSDDEGTFHCQKCGCKVGRLEPAVLNSFLEVVAWLGASLRYWKEVAASAEEAAEEKDLIKPIRTAKKG